MLDPDPPVFPRVREVFEDNFASGREVGAALSIWKDGREAVNLCAGFRDAARQHPWHGGTLSLIWSATKGLAAACALQATERAGLDMETAVCQFWPEFGRAGKADLTLGDVLSHRAGLGALDATDLSILDHEAVVRAIECQPPLWSPEEGPGYGPRTFGCIVDEIVRRLAGIPLGDYWRREFADPLGLELWIGLPESEHARVATMLAARVAGDEARTPFLEAFADPASLTRRAFVTPGGLHAVSAMNSPAARSASIPSMGGIGTASALAKFYAMLALGGRWNGRAFFGDKAVGWMTARRSQGFDKVLRLETSFSAGFMMDPLDGMGRKVRSLLGPSLSAFGHPGAGGSLGFADPENGIGFGYVMNQMESGVLPKERATNLVRALYEPSAITA